MSFFYEKKNKHDRESEMSLFVVTYRRGKNLILGTTRLAALQTKRFCLNIIEIRLTA